MTDPAAAAWRIVVDAAREAYTSPGLAELEEWCEENGYELRYEMTDVIPGNPLGDPYTYPIDRTCPGCGELRAGCESGLCSMRHDDEED